MADDQETPTTDKNNNNGNQKANAKSLMNSAAGEARKGKQEAFKAWAKNKMAEREAAQQRIDMLDAELERAAADFDKGIWVAPNKDQKNNS